MSTTLRTQLIAQQHALLPTHFSPEALPVIPEIAANHVHLLDPERLQKRIEQLNNKPNDDDAANRRLLEDLLKPKPVRMASVDDVTILQQMAERFPHLASLLENLAGDVLLQVIGKRPLQFKASLLLGPPGLGKSWFTRTLAEELDLPYFEFQLGGSGDTLQLFGVFRNWQHASPGDLMRRLASSPIANPLIAFDEVDKTGSSSWGAVSDILLMLLEPENARRFEDKFIGLPARMDYPSYLLTANDAHRLPAPMLDRCRVQTFTLPTHSADWITLVQRLYSNILNLGEGLGRWFVRELSDEQCLAFCHRCASIREVRQRLEEGVQLALRTIPMEQVLQAPRQKLTPVVPRAKPDPIGIGFTSTLGR